MSKINSIENLNIGYVSAAFVDHIIVEKHIFCHSQPRALREKGVPHNSKNSTIKLSKCAEDYLNIEGDCMASGQFGRSMIAQQYEIRSKNIDFILDSKA